MKRRTHLISGGAILLLVLMVIMAAVLLPEWGFNFWPGVLGGAANEGALTVPAGFQIDVYAAGLRQPRFMALGPDGAIYVAEKNADRIIVLADEDGDGQADEVRVFAADVPRPHSLVYHQESWYVGIPSGIIRLRDGDGDGVAEERAVIVGDIPTSGFHTTRTVLFLPDGRMVLSVGSSCNVCAESDPRRATILVYDDAGGAGEQIFAGGLRNAVGLAIQPETGALWATNNGRDLLGDDLPPDTVHLLQNGVNYGWPSCHSGWIIDPDMGFPGACDGVPAPALELQAHSAPLGLAFYDGAMFPADYQGDLFIALHGSWNRRIPTGYKVVRVPFVDGQPGEPVDFATGWLSANNRASSGRPVGILIGADGALYVSDDKAGNIYRISYGG